MTNVILAFLVIVFLAILGGFIYEAFRRKRIIKGWVNIVEGNEVHTVPQNDLVQHEPFDCACSPKTEAVERADGSINWLVIHNALDGRE